MSQKAKLKYCGLLLASTTVCISPAIAESYAYNQSSLSPNTEFSSSSNRQYSGSSVTASISLSGAGASGQAGSETGAPFMAITVPKYIPDIPSGIPPAFDSSSNYAASPQSFSNYVISEQPNSEEAAKVGEPVPKLAIWNSPNRKKVRDKAMFAHLHSRNPL